MLILNAFLTGMWVAIPVSFLWAIAAEFTGWEWMTALLPFVFLIGLMVGAATVISKK